MPVKPFAKLFLGTAIALAAATTGALAGPVTLSFGITGLGSYLVNTTNITLSTATKTVPALELVSGTTTATAFTEAGLATGGAATFSSLTLNTHVGPDPFTLTAGDLVFSFTTVSSVTKIATTSSSLNPPGSISEEFQGSVTQDTSVGHIFLGQSATISETCTQPTTGSSITCSDSVITPGLPVSTPEPVSLALLGVGVFGLGVARRRG
jgi:hypothetical protein